MNPAELLVPAVRWDPHSGFDGQRALIESALELQTGGFIFFGGPADAVRELADELHRRSRFPLLIGADLERGAGQQFAGRTGLPPLAALGWLNDPESMWKAAALTATEARALGVNWVYAPVLDLDVEPENPIVGTRAIGGNPATVARLGRAWIDGCQAQRVLACGKHFPGHGRSTGDSHAELPVVPIEAAVLERTDLIPFIEAARAGVASVMTAHVAFPALDPSGAPATLSAPILTGLLRGRLGFTGLVVTDALIMAGVQEGDAAWSPGVRALAAGCDLLLYPPDLAAAVQEIERAIAGGQLDPAGLAKSAARRLEWAEWAALAAAEKGPDAGVAAEWALETCCRVVHEVRGPSVPVSGPVRFTVIDDDVGGPYPPPSRQPLIDAVRERGVEVAGDDGRGSTHVIALFGDIRAWKGRPGYSARALEQVRAAIAGTDSEPVLVVQFSHPRLAAALPSGVPVVCAWGGEHAMQVAAAEWLVNRCRRS